MGSGPNLSDAGEARTHSQRMEIDLAPNFSGYMASTGPCTVHGHINFNMMKKEDKEKCAVVIAAAAVTTVALAVHETRKRKRVRNIQPNVHRPSIPRPLRTALSTHWRTLVSCGSSSDWIKEINFDRYAVISIILPKFDAKRGTVNYGSPYRHGVKTRGRIPSIESIDILGLTLRYLKSSGRMYELCGTFGLVPTSVSVWVDYGLTVLRMTLRDKTVPEFMVAWPTVQEMDQSYNLLKMNRENGKLLPDVFGVMDGGRFPCADYSNKDVQNAYYEGYTGNVEVTNIFVFNFYGEIIHAGVNYPGSWHDSKVVVASGLLLDRLSDEKTPRGKAILGDSAFVAKARVSHGKIIRGRKSTETEDVPVSELLARVDAVLQRVMPSERQSAEWGIRAMKAPFGRLRLPLPADSTLRLRLLEVCVHLYNLRVRVIGLNQIRTVYGNPGDDQQPWIERYHAEVQQERAERET